MSSLFDGSFGDDWELGAGNVLCIVAATVLFRYGFLLWTLVMPAPMIATAVLLYVFATSIALLLAGLLKVDMRDHGYLVAGIVLSVFFGSLYLILTSIEIPVPGPDAMLFSRYSADLLLQGQNPYAASMAGAWDQYGANTLSVTPKTDGSHVTSLSYPAGAVLAYLPQRALGIPNLGLTNFIVAVGLLGFLTALSRPEFALAPFVVLVGNDILRYSFYGLIDVLWAFPVAVAVHLWATDRRDWAAIAMGIACAIKQQPWIILPFLAVWVYNESDTYGGFLKAAVRLGGYGLVPLLLVNAPFLLWTPTAWLTSVLTPLGGGAGSLVNQGVGLTLLTTTGTALLTKGYYVVVLAVATMWSLILYAVFWERVKWLAWAAPAFILFFHYRSLASYFSFVFPIAYVAVLHAWGLTRESHLPTLATVREWRESHA